MKRINHVARPFQGRGPWAESPALLLALCLLIAHPAAGQSSLQGRCVKWGTAGPIARGTVEVQVTRAKCPDGRRVLASVQSAFSDDRGEFRLFWLPPGRYYLSARHPDIGGSLMRFSAGGMFVGGGGIGPNGMPQFQEF